MTSVRTCYRKQRENVSRKKNDDITDGNRHLPTAVSKRLIIKNKVCRSNRESPIRERSDEKMSKNRSVEVQSNPVLSPETSTALENAEKIINNAKIQLMEVCAMSSLDSGNRNRNTCSNPPLDDEAEELMYIRELVASKFYEANTSKSEANDKTSARLESRSPRVTVPRVDLSAPKFRMSRRRRRAYCQTLKYGSDNRSRECASPAGVPSRDDSSSSKDSNDEDENEATTRDDRARNLPERTSSATGRGLVRARENTCEIQIGPSVHIVDRELTRQDLDDLHISPESTWYHANTATYILRHLDAVESPITSADNEFRKIPRAPRKTLRVRLDTSQRERPIIAEAAAEATSVCVTQQPRDKAHLSESSIYKSDVTTFSNIAPALSSTRTEIQTYGEKHIIQDNHHADAERHVMSANRLSKCEIGCSQRKYSDNVFAQAPRKDTSEAADRLIAYILQDEKQSIEKKVADTLKESTIAPVAVQKLLDNLRNVESIRNARETETLDIFKNILINVQNQTDRETKESLPFVVCSESIQHSKDNSERDTSQTGSVDFAKVTADKNQIYEGVKDVETFPENIADPSIRTNAIEESILQTQGKDNANNIGQIAKKSHDFKKSDKLCPDSSACRETKKDAVRSTALLEFPQSSKNNSKENSEAESLKQISDIRSDDDTLPHKSSENPSTKTVSTKFNEGCTMEANDPVATIIVSAENKEDDMNNERRRDEPSDVQDKDVLQETMKENTIEETHDNITTNQNESPAKVSESKDERIHLDANSIESVDEILEKEDVSLVHSSAKEVVKSLCAIEKDIGLQHSVVVEQVGLIASSCLADSLRDHASLTCVKNSKLSIKEVTSHIEQSIIAGENDLVKDTKNDETHGKPMTIIAVDNRKDGIEDSEFLKNTKSNNEEQLNDLQKYKIDILSSSNSSVSSTLLDYDNRSTNDALNANAKRIETSSETSHSEGELYMPSSCSYSLGEVRVLKKRELISDNSIDRDSNATILVTRSMLTSLNDSPVSLLTSSGCI
ncbi:uncharacterized protein LOC115234511 [Formica exsecta]|uniref:uncharacterized protein LOC115234511 n=1 Tax=Formica exsecta TaxID=72781 RepID=UPI0011441598|nr:uncharacterized protein LOC115234511 [Formica exsecta]